MHTLYLCVCWNAGGEARGPFPSLGGVAVESPGWHHNARVPQHRVRRSSPTLDDRENCGPGDVSMSRKLFWRMTSKLTVWTCQWTKAAKKIIHEHRKQYAWRYKLCQPLWNGLAKAINTPEGWRSSHHEQFYRYVWLIDHRLPLCTVLLQTPPATRVDTTQQLRLLREKMAGHADGPLKAYIVPMDDQHQVSYTSCCSLFEYLPCMVAALWHCLDCWTPAHW